MSYIYDPLYRALYSKPKKAIHRIFGKYGNWYNYRPRRDLIQNLSRKLNISEDEVYSRLMDIRWQILIREGFAHVPQLNPFV